MGKRKVQCLIVYKKAGPDSKVPRQQLCLGYNSQVRAQMAGRQQACFGRQHPRQPLHHPPGRRDARGPQRRLPWPCPLSDPWRQAFSQFWPRQRLTHGIFSRNISDCIYHYPYYIVYSMVEEYLLLLGMILTGGSSAREGNRVGLAKSRDPFNLFWYIWNTAFY